MSEGLRERKKRRTREALVAAAVELFQRQGYEATTVAQIAAAADVSTRTFFLHFPAKEDVVLGDADARVELAVRLIEERAADERPPDVLARVIERAIVQVAGTDLATGLADVRVRLVLTVPELQAWMVRRLLSAQQRIVEALCRSYPEEHDVVAVAAMVGAMMGAVTSAASYALRRGDSPGEVADAMRRAAASLTVAPAPGPRNDHGESSTPPSG
ncbi:TetR/AcrR family transcriptional regulator [Nonomuraea jiangxiensis]|uniref:DNA-binding transcriptional regulator, AcrR family n=1 Tax=Nonomuraea jiangxiensis TaxID=633440 RepID=A0A1G9S6Y6_9ACTN|nr:TetR/AcrR family transcriptional regulator [Nonomuraea jiangxiensis]SDM31184.1 DNA-binding transcriptional regulator, AcrR family [Nonomuraea jiangxiensis]